jgi:ABC-type transporter Mla subunit MlaD
MTPALAWTLALVLLAVVVGFTIPVLLQLRRTLGSAQNVLDGRLSEVLDEATAAIARLNRVSEELEKGATNARGLLDSARELGGTLASLRQSLPTAAALGSSIGPVLASVVQTLLGRWTGGAPAPAAGSPAPAAEKAAERTAQGGQ